MNNQEDITNRLSEEELIEENRKMFETECGTLAHVLFNILKHPLPTSTLSEMRGVFQGNVPNEDGEKYIYAVATSFYDPGTPGAFPSIQFDEFFVDVCVTDGTEGIEQFLQSAHTAKNYDDDRHRATNRLHLYSFVGSSEAPNWRFDMEERRWSKDFYGHPMVQGGNDRDSNDPKFVKEWATCVKSWRPVTVMVFS